MATITVNGVRREVQAPGDTPLLYVLRNDLELRRSAVRLRTRAVRSLFRSDRRQGSAFLHYGPLATSLPTRKSPRSKVCLRGGPSKRASRRRKRRPRFTRCSKPGSRSRLRSAAFARTG